MKLSKVGASLIKKYEGCRLKAYKDPTGVWTIGYGHTSGVKQGGVIIQEQAEQFFLSDVERFENAVNKYNDIYNFNQNQFDALVSFTYNLGEKNLKSLTATGTRSITTISAKIPLYNKAGGVALRGLQRRRAEEKDLFDTPTNEVSYYPTYKGNSPRVDEVLETIGAIPDYDLSQPKPYLKRKPIAEAQNIKKYIGTAAQNNKIIKLASTGKLKRV